MPLSPRQFNLSGLREKHIGDATIQAHAYDDPLEYFDEHFANVRDGGLDYWLMQEEHERRMEGTLED